jgi:hypothetical protein
VADVWAQRELQLHASQVMALFNKAMLKLYGFFRGLAEAAVAGDLPSLPATVRRTRWCCAYLFSCVLQGLVAAAAPSLEADLDEAAREAMGELRKKREALVSDPALSKYVPPVSLSLS